MGGAGRGVSPYPATPSGTGAVERSDTTAPSSGAPKCCEPGWSGHLNSFSNVSGSDDGASPPNAPPPSPVERSDTTAPSSGAPKCCEPGWSGHLNTFSNVSGSDDGASPPNAPPPSPGGGSPDGSFSADGGSGGSLSGRRGTGPEGFAKRSGNSGGRGGGLAWSSECLPWPSVIMRSYQRKCTVSALLFCARI